MPNTFHDKFNKKKLHSPIGKLCTKILIVSRENLVVGWMICQLHDMTMICVQKFSSIRWMQYLSTLSVFCLAFILFFFFSFSLIPFFPLAPRCRLQCQMNGARFWTTRFDQFGGPCNDASIAPTIIILFFHSWSRPHHQHMMIYRRTRMVFEYNLQERTSRQVCKCLNFVFVFCSHYASIHNVRTLTKEETNEKCYYT